MVDCRICVQDCSIREDVWDALKENCRNYKPNPITNGDKLRAMSDEELADWLVMNGNGEDYKSWLDWLRQEAAE